MSAHAFRVRVHDSGTSTPSDATVDFTLDTQLAEVPMIPGQTVDPVRGRTQSRPWSVRVVDASDVITSRLADADGRMNLLGRIVDIQRNVDSAGWATLATGRLSDLNETDGPGLWELKVEDERWVERNAKIFTAADTTQVYPLGIRYKYRDYPVADTQAMNVVAVRGNCVLLEWDTITSGGPMSAAVQDLISEDLKSETTLLTSTTVGNFETLRADVSGTDREVVGFAYALNTAGNPNPTLGLESLDSTDPLFYVWVVWASSQPSVGDSVTIALHMATRAPTEALPLHLGVASASHDLGTSDGGIHPFDLLTRLYDDAGVRYDSVAMSALSTDGRYPRMFLRVTEPQDLATFAEDYIYGPLSVVPFIDAAGQVAPKAVHLPEDLDPDTLTELDSANQAEQPTFRHARREVVNALRFKFRSESYITDEQLADDSNAAADRIRVAEHSFTREYDSQAELGRHEVEYRLDGFHTRTGLEGFAGDVVSGIHREKVADYLSTEVFQRFGDGPIRGRLVGLSDTESIDAGDLVIIALDTFPNPALNDRGGERIVQILAKDLTPAGPEFEYLDIGQKLQPIGGPTVSIAKSVLDPSSAVLVTISDIPTGATAEVQLAYSDTEPSYSSDLWFPAGTLITNGTASYPNNPTGATVWARARTIAAGRIRSAWSDPVSVTLDSNSFIRNVRGYIRSGVKGEEPDGRLELTWEASSIAVGLKILYEVHEPREVPPETLSNSVDMDAQAEEVTLDVGLILGQAVTVELEPWTGFTDGAVSGTAGPRVRRTIYTSTTVDTPESRYGFTSFIRRNKETTVEFIFTVGDLVSEVWWVANEYAQDSVPANPYPDKDDPDLSAYTVLVVGTDTLKVSIDIPDFGNVKYAQFEARKEDLSFGPGNNVMQVEIQPNKVDTPGILDAAITAIKVANEAIEQAKIKQRAVGTNQLELAGVARDNIAAKAINAALLDDDILDLTAFSRVVANNAIIGDKLSVSKLSEIADDCGIVVSGELRNALGTRYIDLDATGTDPFIAHDKFEIRADGTAIFTGELIAATGTFTGSLTSVDGTFTGELVSVNGSFTGELIAATGTFVGELTAATGTFAGDITAATGTFSGTVASTSFTASIAEFSGVVDVVSGTDKVRITHSLVNIVDGGTTVGQYVWDGTKVSLLAPSSDLLVRSSSGDVSVTAGNDITIDASGDLTLEASGALNLNVTTSASAGTTSGYIVVNINGVQKKIAYHNNS